MPSDVEMAYAQSADFVAWLAGHRARGRWEAAGRGVAAEPFEMAFGKAFRSSLSVEEDRWRDGLATRFGWLPLTTSMQLVWLVAPAICVVAYVRRRRQLAARLEAMAAEEAAEDAALRVLAAEAAQQGLPPPPETIPDWVEPPPEEPREAMEGEHPHDARPSKPTLH